MSNIIKIHYRGRLTFIRDKIEILRLTDVFEIETNEGIFRMSKQEFYSDFDNVIKTKSYLEDGIYHYSKMPQKALKYKINDSTNEVETNLGENKLNSKIEIPKEIIDGIRNIGILWRNSKLNPSIKEKALLEWDKIIEEWAYDKNIPLIIRKSSSPRGIEIDHTTGRKIIISDNSPAQWIYFNLLRNIVFSKNDIAKKLEQDEIPISYAIKKTEKYLLKYKKTLGKYSINNDGWKLCHIQKVGLNTKEEISKINIDTLIKAFKLLMKPTNMFLIPIEIGGIGEIKEFIEEQINFKHQL